MLGEFVEEIYQYHARAPTSKAVHHAAPTLQPKVFCDNQRNKDEGKYHVEPLTNDESTKKFDSFQIIQRKDDGKEHNEAFRGISNSRNIYKPVSKLGKRLL